jgi:hypothetical protein
MSYRCNICKDTGKDWRYIYEYGTRIDIEIECICAIEETDLFINLNQEEDENNIQSDGKRNGQNSKYRDNLLS